VAEGHGHPLVKYNDTKLSILFDVTFKWIKSYKDVSRSHMVAKCDKTLKLTEKFKNAYGRVWINVVWLFLKWPIMNKGPMVSYSQQMFKVWLRIR
jgi:hypothetical protein